jgi:catechol 2,3-dioxygenase-like lactoylglutathione lyase family enzyme
VDHVTPSIRLDQVNLIVSDMAATRAFYTRIGVDFGPAGDDMWDRHHVSAQHTTEIPLDIDLDSSTFAQQWNVGWPGGPGVVLGFKVAGRQEVDDLVAQLAAEGVPIQQPPYDAFWGARYAVVTDPDGNGVGIMSPVDPERRSTGPMPE